MTNLTKYNEKRDFEKTNEPKGKVKKNSQSRFVIQHHLARNEHYDFRLEYDGVLLSWAVPKGLSQSPDDKRLAVHVEDHPVDYINFEGIIPKGNYGAGSVDIFDKGFYEPIIDMQQGLEKGHLKFTLHGEKLNGVWSLIKTDEKNWLIVKSKQDTDNKSIIKNPFSKVDVKLAKMTEHIPDKDYIFEIKYDGYRMVAYCEDNVVLKSRNNNDYTEKFPSIVQSLKALEHSMVLDGEVVSFDKNGRSDFGLLNQNVKYNIDNFCYVVFDILALDGIDLRDKKLLERKEILKKATKNLPKNIIFSSFSQNDGEKCFLLAKNNNLEGIVAKNVNSVYNGYRNSDWLKIKCFKRQEFVIGGYEVTNKNPDLSNIYLGYYDDKKLVYVGKAGIGFNDKLKKELHEKFKKMERKTCPFINTNQKAIWITPKLVAEIQFSEITKDKILRHPCFISLRLDKQAKDVRLEY